MLLTVSDLNVWFGEDQETGQLEFRQVLHDVCLSLETGTTTALVGESGSGKSVTALSILRLLEEASTIKTKGSIRFNNTEILTLPPEQVRKIRGNSISMVFQEPMTSLNPVYPVGDQLIEPLLLHRGMNRAEAEREAIRLLEMSRLDHPRERLSAFPHQLSGGQRQRVMIAMALACRPQLLIADEPTTALDVTVQAQILELIKDLQHTFNMAVLLITHDLTMVRKVADTISIMKDGRVVESGEAQPVLNNPGHDYTRHLLAAIPDNAPPPPKKTKVLLKADNLHCTFTIGKGWLPFLGSKGKTVQAVADVNFCLQAGSTCGIIGESGSGKTTLAMALLKLIPSKGVIFFEGTDLQGLSGRAMRSRRSDIQIVFQDPFSSLSPRLTVFQIIEEGLRIHFRDYSPAHRRDAVYDALAEVGLDRNAAQRFPHEFSGGQRQRIAIARVIVLKPKLLILDEPTSALDVTIQRQILDLLKALQEKYGISYLFISHDLRVVRAISDYVAVMQHGRIIEQGPAGEVFNSPGREYTKRLFNAALT